MVSSILFLHFSAIVAFGDSRAICFLVLVGVAVSEVASTWLSLWLVGVFGPVDFSWPWQLCLRVPLVGCLLCCGWGPVGSVVSQFVAMGLFAVVSR